MAYYVDTQGYDHTSASGQAHSTGGASHYSNQHRYQHQQQQHQHHHPNSYSTHDPPSYSTHYSHMSGGPSSGASPRSYPAYDPDSPFNSAFVPIKSMGPDGRLKTKLMGIGLEGGYLTSPLIGGNPRLDPSTTIAIDSPVPSESFTHDHGPLTNLAPRTSSLAARNSSYLAVSTGSDTVGSMTGMGIGMPELGNDLELGDFANPETTMVTSARPRSRMGPAYQPTRTTAEDDSAEAPEVAAAASSAKPTPTVTSFPGSPPPAGKAQAPATGRRPRKQLTLKSLNKAKSCSALSPAAKAQQYGGEPLTPVSSHSSNFVIPGVPFNSPLDEALAQSADPAIMPLSFADLYSYGLAIDPANEIDVRKSPYQFANDLLSADGNIGMGIGFPQDDGQDYQASLPTPSFAHDSGFSSPFNSSRSGPSPDLNNWGSPSHLSSSSMMQAPSMLSAPSMESAYSLPMAMAPQSASRQRCATYHAGAPARHDSLDPALVSPGPRSPMHSRQLSTGPAYGQQAKYPYPSRYQSHGQGVPMMWANSVPPSQAQTPHLAHQHPQYINTVHTTMFIPPYHEASVINSNNNNTDALEDMYEGISAASTGYSTPGKRGRGDLSEDEGERDDDATPRAVRMAAAATSPSPHKKLRTVASAPCLPTRRMRPGPKPKSLKSPQEQHQSSFHLSSPPIPQVPRFSRSETPASDDEDDEDSSKGGNAQAGSLPKEVIQSLYKSVPAHVDDKGVKVSKRYLCLMESCERTFPRKSAIESHIQTHLEDKPFVCPYEDCEASFVRQHDLRRHERIHSGNKPFPCPCGKGFARGDALARHRARGICEGSLVPRRT
ncbi:BQ2448_2155 [Microbotryum intermedium]|uniref:BQ2448_2155 protein n=1 Tax=Microbotryum intermedium TaxID=269621 RepID=A0A238F7G3_9BASI|nr:BQ2448_2155 [Microbotryum intermedium]